MESYNPNWIRWCALSYAKHVDSLREGIPFYIEGFAPNPDNMKENESYFELRIDGPYTQEKAKGQWNLYFEINVLIVHHQADTKAWEMQRLISIVNKFFNDSRVMVRKYGTGPDDDQDLLGWLQLRPTPVKSSNFGRIRPDVRIHQGTVEGHYNLYMD